jgi:hypothetical protein
MVSRDKYPKRGVSSSTVRGRIRVVVGPGARRHENVEQNPQGNSCQFDRSARI